MPNDSKFLEERVSRLEEEVQGLRRTVSLLEQTLAGQKPVQKEKRAIKPAPAGQGASEEILSWVDKSAILPRVATTSFIVVVALALRTASDSDMIDLQLGSFLGILYAFGLIVYGWFAYRENNIQAPVFTLWGTIVMCAIVVEAHRVFDTVPTELAYLVLAITGGSTTIISRLHHVALPVFVGTIGMSFAAFAIDYPNPHFPYLTVVMILANIFATYATRLLRASWLRWLLLVLTLFMVQIWDLKLAIYLGKLAPDQLDFSIRGFLAAISLLAGSYVVIALLGVLGKIQKKVSKFDIALPVITVGWFFLAGRYAVQRGLTDDAVFGWMGVSGAVVLLGLAWWLARREPGGGLGTTSFALAGGFLLAFSAPMAFGHSLIATVLVAVLAVGMALFSRMQGNLGLRLSSYLLQIYACAALVFLLRTTEGTSPSLLGAVSSGLLAAIAFFHYYWARRHPPEMPPDSLVARFNKNDRGATALLVAALFSGFFTLRVGLYQVLDSVHMATYGAFIGAQSVLVNLTAAILFLVCLFRRNRELRNVAVIITLIGAARVLLDMLQIKGLPLMLSVFTFGLVAAFASFVLGRWNRGQETDSQQPPADE